MIHDNISIHLLCITGSSAKGPLVTSKLGRIQGLKASDGDYNMFLGIPYGKVDKGKPFGVR
jgi:hypothetical protein